MRYALIVRPRTRLDNLVGLRVTLDGDEVDVVGEQPTSPLGADQVMAEANAARKR